MRLLFLCMFTLLAVGCTSMQAQTDYKQQRIQTAQAEAERIGNSEPLYNLWEDCLNLNWLYALDAGEDEMVAYHTGLKQCARELTSLCDYYGVNTCKQDAEISHRVLFSVLIRSYDQHLQQVAR